MTQPPPHILPLLCLPPSGAPKCPIAREDVGSGQRPLGDTQRHQRVRLKRPSGACPGEGGSLSELGAGIVMPPAL